jgi:hypothetical protein
MRFRTILAGCAACLMWLAVLASSQTSQVGKTWELGRGLANQLDSEVDPIVWTKFRPFLDGAAG